MIPAIQATEIMIRSQIDRQPEAIREAASRGESAIDKALEQIPGIVNSDRNIQVFGPEEETMIAREYLTRLYGAYGYYLRWRALVNSGEQPNYVAIFTPDHP